MKLSPQWIRDFVDLTVGDHRLAEDLTNVGISVEGISGTGADTVFEMEIGTNRPDAALKGRSSTATVDTMPFPITVEEPALCPRFSARVIRATRIGPSPEEVAHRLQLLDQRPISNAVDATNYVLWEI